MKHSVFIYMIIFFSNRRLHIKRVEIVIIRRIILIRSFLFFIIFHFFARNNPNTLNARVTRLNKEFTDKICIIKSIPITLRMNGVNATNLLEYNDTNGLIIIERIVEVEMTITDSTNAFLKGLLVFLLKTSSFNVKPIVENKKQITNSVIVISRKSSLSRYSIITSMSPPFLVKRELRYIYE